MEKAKYVRSLTMVITTVVMTLDHAARSTTPHDVLNLWSPICDPSLGYAGIGDEFIR